MEENQETLETLNNEQAENLENAVPGNENEQKERVFTQAELDDIVTKRLERDRESTAKRVAQEARDSYIAKQGHVWNGKPITTEAEYDQAVHDQELINQYRQKDLPDDVINELVESKKFRKQYETDNQQKAKDEKIKKDFEAFATEYPSAKVDEIPAIVWEDVSKGRSLVDAFARHENQTLKQKLADIEAGRNAEDFNDDNAASSTGSAKGKGTNQPAFFTAAQVNAMSDAEVDKNWTAIMASQKKW